MALEIVQQPQHGEPQWIERTLNVKAGRDPLGLQTITQDRILPILLPGILVLSRRARYFTFYPFLLQEFERRSRVSNNDALSEFIKLREFEFAACVQLCPRGCGTKSAGAAGKDRAAPALALNPGQPIARQESVESHLGGYGLYYRTPLVDLGVVLPRGTPYGSDEDSKVTPVDILQRDERATRLAESFRDAVKETSYYQDWFVRDDAIPISVLKEYADRACLCRLSESASEQALIRETLFAVQGDSSPAFVTRDVDQRRRSFALFLRELDQEPAVSDSDAAFRARIWDDFVSSPGGTNALSDTVAQWAALVAKEYWQEGLSSIFTEFWRTGLDQQPADGLTLSEVDQLVRNSLVGSSGLDLKGGSIAVGATTTMNSFVASVTKATSSMSLEGLRRIAASEVTALSGLVLVTATLSRLPDPTVAPGYWREIGSQSSERQPSVLGFALAFRGYLEANPTVTETLIWIVRQFIIGAHEQIAYSKLPDYTFRFRWENGRLRFYNIGPGRFDLADMRRESIARISEDCGLWFNEQGGARLTDIGRSFVAEVLE